MKIYSDNIEDYLTATDIIDYDDHEVALLAEKLRASSVSEMDLIQRCYEYVRDEISHSADIDSKVVTCNASEVLKHREGICYPKSHLLAALLRKNGIPTGFCYQILILDDDEAPYLILHGLNGVYIAELDRWIRLDARGNKSGVDAQFSVNEEVLAFSVDETKGEQDILLCYPEPDPNVIEGVRRHDSVETLFNDLPRELARM